MDGRLNRPVSVGRLESRKSVFCHVLGGVQSNVFRSREVLERPRITLYTKKCII